jgi:hypothetical protein
MTRRPIAACLLLVAVLLGALSPLRAAAQRVDPDWVAPRTVYIPETGQTIDQLFLDLWRGSGGEAAFGNPITPEITEADGHVVQWYEYARFEYWPAGDAQGNYVTLGNIGAELRPVSPPRLVGRGKAVEMADAPTLQARAWVPLRPDQIPSDSEAVRYVAETGHSVRDGFKAFWDATGGAAYLGNPLTEAYDLEGTSYQVFERGQLSQRPGAVVELVPVGTELVERYGLDTRPVEQGDVPTYDEDLFVAPSLEPEFSAAPLAPAGATKSIVISLTDQALWAYEGREVVKATYVSTGTKKFKTPPGLFYINTKLPVEDMAGVIGGESYDVPKVPDVMYFTDVGHAIHGAYWHDNFGEPMSHGCVNLPLDVSKWLYDWAPVGTPVLIVA